MTVATRTTRGSTPIQRGHTRAHPGHEAVVAVAGQAGGEAGERRSADSTHGLTP